jgi:hypothetical protein
MGEDSRTPGSVKSHSASAPLTKSDPMPTARTFDDEERYGLRAIEVEISAATSCGRIGTETARTSLTLS